MFTPKVLLVNDDPAGLLALSSLLTYGAGGKDAYEVITAQSGEEALRHVLRQDFAVILLDVRMPGMDGFETAEAIHSHPRSSFVPIIFITAYFADEINRLKGYQRGAVDYLFSPIIPQVLQAKVAVFVELAKKNIELQQKTQQLEELNLDLQAQRVRDLERINAALETEVVERRQAEQRAHELATRDSLTKLPNRRSLIEKLEHAIVLAARKKKKLALLFLDLDRFKVINDTLGHDVGDMLLVQVAARLNAAVRDADVAARLGGDEFVVLIEDVAEAGDVATVAEKIIHSIALPYELGAHNIRTSTSIGISLYPEDGTSAQALMKTADLAMYHAKEQRRGSMQFFHQGLNAKMMERVQFESELQQAIEQNEFEMYYQPKLEIASGAMVGVEALLRWKHPRMGIIPAERFISTATDYRLLASIGEWVISSVCQQLQQWGASGNANLNIPVAINLATSQIQPALPAAVRHILGKHKISPDLLQLEITEPSLLHELDRVCPVLQELSANGLKIALDDFGTGYSSLSLLQAVPIDILKIDQSLVHKLGASDADTAIASAVINMAHAMSLRVVAEGVETKEQLATLTRLGCEDYQGHLFSEALSVDMLEKKLLKQANNVPTPSSEGQASSSHYKLRIV